VKRKQMTPLTPLRNRVSKNDPNLASEADSLFLAHIARAPSRCLIGNGLIAEFTRGSVYALGFFRLVLRLMLRFAYGVVLGRLCFHTGHY